MQHILLRIRIRTAKILHQLHHRGVTRNKQFDVFTRVPIPQRRQILPRLLLRSKYVNLRMFFGERVVVAWRNSNAAGVVAEATNELAFV